jgi:hypothetical protein
MYRFEESLKLQVKSFKLEDQKTIYGQYLQFSH